MTGHSAGGVGGNGLSHLSLSHPDVPLPPVEDAALPT